MNDDVAKLIASALSDLGKAVNDVKDAVHYQTQTLQGTINNGTDKTVSCMHDLKLEIVQGHNAIKNKIYIALIGMVSILLTMVGIWMK